MIEKYSFGNIIINGRSYSQDIKILQNKIIHPWYREKGHSVDQKDLQDVIKTSPEILILGKGNPGMMTSTPNLRKVLSSKGIELREAPTAQAIQEFNQLLNQGREVAAGFHLTC